MKAAIVPVMRVEQMQRTPGGKSKTQGVKDGNGESSVLLDPGSAYATLMLRGTDDKKWWRAHSAILSPEQARDLAGRLTAWADETQGGR